MTERVPYDEFSMFGDNAAEYDIPYDGPPTVRLNWQRMRWI